MQSKFPAGPGRYGEPADERCKRADGRPSCRADKLVVVFNNCVQEFDGRQIRLNAEKGLDFIAKPVGGQWVSRIAIHLQRLVDDLQVAIVKLRRLWKRRF